MKKNSVKNIEQFIDLCERTSLPYGIIFDLGCDRFIKFMDDFMDILSRVEVVDNDTITCCLVSTSDESLRLKVSQEYLDEHRSEDWWRKEILVVIQEIAKRAVVL